MWNINTIHIFFLFLCLNYEYGSSARLNHEFDMLIFAQQWPTTNCMAWKYHKPSHVCSMPNNVNRWTIHGVWPMKLGMEGPWFCNSTWTFDPEKIRPIEQQLSQDWPNLFREKSVYEFWSHEWKKHGTCAALLQPMNSELNFFSTSLSWLERYSMSKILEANNITPSNTEAYSINDINNAIKNELGYYSDIQCTKENGRNYLMQIRTCFTKDFLITDCDGRYKTFGDETILTNCDDQDIMYPSYKTNYIQLHKLRSWIYL